MQLISTIKIIGALALAGLFGYFAYRLFFVNVERQGHMELSLLGMKAKVSKVAPGIFFALVALGIIGFIFYRPTTATQTTEEQITSADGTITTRKITEQQTASAAQRADVPSHAVAEPVPAGR